MLLVLIPLAFIFLPIQEVIGSCTLALSFNVLACESVAIGEGCGSLSIGLSFEHLTLVDSTIGKSVIAYLNLLSRQIGHTDKIENNPYKKISKIH